MTCYFVLCDPFQLTWIGLLLLSIGLVACLFRLSAPPGLCLKMAYHICYGNSLYNLVLAHKGVRCLELIALEALLLHLPFSVTGHFVAFWRRLLGGQTLYLRLFICGIYLLIQMQFTLWDLSLLLVNALGNLHLFLICSRGGGSVILVFSLVTYLAVLLLWYGTCPILRGYYCKGSILFSPYFTVIITFLLYCMSCNCLPGVP